VFESAMGRYEAASGRPLTGALLSIAAHAIIVAAVIALPGKKVSHREEPPEVILQVPVQKPALLGSPGPAKPTTALPKRPRPKKVPLLAKEPETPPTPSVEEPKDPDPQENTGEAASSDGAGNGGSLDGVPNGDPNGKGKGPPVEVPEQKPQNQVLTFTGDMTRPSLASGPSQPDYPREALVARVEGTAVVQCTITAEGLARDCRILKSLPYLDGAIQGMLAKQRYIPATYAGRPVSVRYSLTFHFKLR